MAPPTIDLLLKRGWYNGATRPHWAAVADFTVDGERLGAQPVRFRAPSPNETRFEKKHGETLLMAHALASLGYREVAVTARESPDFYAQLPHGTVGIEVAELVEPESARWHNAIENVRVAVRDALEADPSLQRTLGDQWLSVNFWDCPKRTDEFRLIDELSTYLRSGAFLDVGASRIVDPRFPTMTAHRAHRYGGTFEGGYLDVTLARFRSNARRTRRLQLEKRLHAHSRIKRTFASCAGSVSSGDPDLPCSRPIPPTPIIVPGIVSGARRVGGYSREFVPEA